MQCKDDHNGGDIRRESFRRVDRHDLMSALETQPLLKILRQGDRTKETLWRSIKVVGPDVFCAVLELRDRHVFREREFFARYDRPPREGRQHHHGGNG